LKKAEEIKPDAAILVDYPGFNLRLAKELKKRKIKVIYYISPQIWAWGLRRVKLIKKVVDKMIVVFKFEEALYKKFGIDALFVGHPFLDMVTSTTSRETFLRNNGLSTDKLIIGLMPGSRTREVEVHLPIMLESAKLIYRDIPNSQFMVIKSPTVSKVIFDIFLNRYSLPLKKIENVSYDSINSCDFLLVASGSATLEAAILLKPMVIIYKVSFLTWLFLKFMLRIHYVGLVNVVAERKIVPEYLQFDATPKRISAETNRILSDQIELSQIKIDLSKVKEKLGEKGASNLAAKEIVGIIS
jgi:lipid-A-disaccharide synthase